MVIKRIKKWFLRGEKTARLKRGIAIKPLTKEDVEVLICGQAYSLFERRGCSHGSDMDDWLEAERIVTKTLAK